MVPPLFVIVTLLCTCASLAACDKDKTVATKDPQSSEKSDKKLVLPQAAPMIAILGAARASDAGAFRKAYSKRIREGSEQADWEKNVGEARANLKRMFGDYKVEDFTFSFDGGDDNGKLTIRHEGTEPIVIAVINEGGDWKLDER